MRGTENRGQTAIDFVVGAGLFVLAVAFVLAFVPSMFAPFFGLGVGDALVSDRSAAYLAENALVEDPDTPGVLNESAVNETLDASACEEGGGAHLADTLSVGTENINVTLGNQSDPQAWSCGEPPSGAETVSQRIVWMDGTQYTLRVVVW